MDTTPVGREYVFGSVHLPFFVNAFGLRESLETFWAMISAHARRADAAERYVIYTYMRDGVVQAYAAGVCVLEHTIAVVLIPVEIVKR